MSIEEKTCPQCAEKIKLAALVCKHCGKVFDSSEVASAVRKSRRDLGMGCLTLIALIGLLAWCTSTPTPKTADWFAREGKSAITSFAAYGDHLDVEIDVGDPGELGSLPAEIGGQLRAVRARLDKDKQAQTTTTMTVSIWFAASESKGGGRKPLMILDGHTADFLSLPVNAPATDLMNAFEKVRARPPLGDLLMKDACNQAPSNFSVSKICLS
ncbi:MAG: hypothetical protein DI623_14810 [Sphingomonas sanxanigenens]|uniref:Uncharacterized protein n=1 Tax=Sphingomonas sanxanigenens TaxID=397260 RepID=A0A2W5BWD2_9SPHN|nr:MAG: hypothetical protein DI623_14810 [Sphingomonas sanxanigenens]